MSFLNRFKFWEAKVGRYALQRLGRGWQTLREYPLPIKFEEVEDVEQGVFYRLMEIDLESGRMKRQRWIHKAPGEPKTLPSGEPKKQARKGKPIDPVQAMDMYAERLESDFEPLERLGNLMSRLQGTFGGGGSPQGEGIGTLKLSDLVKPEPISAKYLMPLILQDQIGDAIEKITTRTIRTMKKEMARPPEEVEEEKSTLSRVGEALAELKARRLPETAEAPPAEEETETTTTQIEGEYTEVPIPEELEEADETPSLELEETGETPILEAEREEDEQGEPVSEEPPPLPPETPEERQIPESTEPTEEELEEGQEED